MFSKEIDSRFRTPLGPERAVLPEKMPPSYVVYVYPFTTPVTAEMASEVVESIAKPAHWLASYTAGEVTIALPRNERYIVIRVVAPVAEKHAAAETHSLYIASVGPQQRAAMTEFISRRGEIVENATLQSAIEQTRFRPNQGKVTPSTVIGALRTVLPEWITFLSICKSGYKLQINKEEIQRSIAKHSSVASQPLVSPEETTQHPLSVSKQGAENFPHEKEIFRKARVLLKFFQDHPNQIFKTKFLWTTCFPTAKLMSIVTYINTIKEIEPKEGAHLLAIGEGYCYHRPDEDFNTEALEGQSVVSYVENGVTMCVHEGATHVAVLGEPAVKHDLGETQKKVLRIKNGLLLYLPALEISFVSLLLKSGHEGIERSELISALYYNGQAAKLENSNKDCMRIARILHELRQIIPPFVTITQAKNRYTISIVG